MRMRPFLLVLSLALAGIAGADDLLGVADYMKIISDSKLRYNIATEPAKKPVKEMDCPRRDLSTRVVKKGAGKSLVDWELKPEAKKLLAEGETFWDQKNFASASEKYKAAIDADPEAATAYFYYGDALLFGADDSASALVQYRKGIALDPTMPSGHLFASTALTRLGRRDDAREEIIKALTYYPGYEAVWKITANPELWNARPIVRHKFEPPAGYLGENGPDGIDVYAGKDLKWLGYAMCKAAWANEPRFAKDHQAGGWSNKEERACIAAQLEGDFNKAEKAAGEGAKHEQIMAALDPLDQHLWDVINEKLLDGYIYFEIIGQHCPLALSMMDDESKAQVEQYIRKYVIVPAQ
jgi:tetratricopeptide (TPR) repeat protein